MTRAPSSPPRFPVCIEDETKMVNGSVVLHGGVKLVVAYPPPHTVSPSSIRESAFEKSSWEEESGRALTVDGIIKMNARMSATMMPSPAACGGRSLRGFLAPRSSELPGEICRRLGTILSLIIGIIRVVVD